MKTFLLLLCLWPFSHLFAQKDSPPSLDIHCYTLNTSARNLDSSFVALRIFRSHKTNSSGNVYVDMVFINNTPAPTTVRWFDFERSWGVPICANFTLIQTDTVGANWIDFNWGMYMDPNVYKGYQKVTYDIEMQPYEVVVKTISLWWVGMDAGTYDLQIDFYNRFNQQNLPSNTLSFDLKKNPFIQR